MMPKIRIVYTDYYYIDNIHDLNSIAVSPGRVVPTTLQGKVTYLHFYI